MPFFRREDIDFYFEEHGRGPAFVFSHGLGGNGTQAHDLIGDLPNIRLIVYDNRGHGRTSGIGHPARLTFSVMADDMAALLDFLSIPVATVGGVSMGAGIAIAFGMKRRDRTKALILSRPAWLNVPEPPNLAVLQKIADLVKQFGREGGLDRFRKSDLFASIEATAPETARSLAGSFMERSAEAIISTFRAVPASVPFRSFEELVELDVPALILGNRIDPVHPFEYCQRLSSALPRSSLQEFPSKSESVELHNRRFRELVTGFLMKQEDT